MIIETILNLVAVLLVATVLAIGLILLVLALLGRFRPRLGRRFPALTGSPILGAFMTAAALYVGGEYGQTNLYALWLAVRAPSHVWYLVSAPEVRTSIGGAAVDAHSFGGDVELSAQSILIGRDGNDLLVHAGRLDALQRKPWSKASTATTVYARINRGTVHTGFGRRGPWMRVELSGLADSLKVGLSVPLSSLSPHASLGSQTFRFPDGVKHCEKECYVDFRLELTSGSGARFESNTIWTLVRPG